jgi:hypothetical protein
MFVVHRTGVVIREDFKPIDCTAREGMATEFNRREHKTESNCFVVTNSSVGNRFAVTYLLVKGLRARKNVMQHAWNAAGVKGGGNTGVRDIFLLCVIEERVLDLHIIAAQDVNKVLAACVASCYAIWPEDLLMFINSPCA